MGERPWYWVLERVGGGLIVFGGVVVAAAASSSGTARRDWIAVGIAVAAIGLLTLGVGALGQMQGRGRISPPTAPATDKPADNDGDPNELSESPEELIAIAKSNTDLRAKELLRPYLFKRIRVEGLVEDVDRTYASGKYRLRVRVRKSNNLGSQTLCQAYFEDAWQDRLSTLEVGKPVALRGELKGVDSFWGLSLYESQLVELRSKS
jgi:hypothetical protein